MDLNKIKLHSCKQTGKAESQITLDDDYNVPDYRPDIVKVLKEKGELCLDEVSATAGAVWIKGRLVFKVLYRSDQENGKISCLRGEIPFQEKLNMDKLLEYEPVSATGEMEDLTIGVIHSRKISVRAVLLLKAEVEKEAEEEIATGVEEACGCEQKYDSRKAMQLLLMKKDICRQKSEIVLPSSKPNVREILWKSLELRNLETHLNNRMAKLTGEILVSILYSEEEENERLQWYETMIPLDCGVECDAGEETDIVYKILAEPASMELEVKPDYDGEERILVLELAIDLTIRVWKEIEIRWLEDMYSLKKELHFTKVPITLNKIAVKNESQCKITERMELPENQEKILQICSCEGEAHLEHYELTKRGVKAEGVLLIEILYVTTDDQMPIGVVKEVYPFEQLVEIPEQSGLIKTELECRIGQLSAIMLDQEHVEVKAMINLNLFATEEDEISSIQSVEETPLDIENLQKRPGLIGYITKEGDSLWTIAKENHTTVDEIMNNNHRKEERLKKGERILIVKKVE